MVISFILAKRFRQKIYIFLSGVTIVLVSFLSVGLPYQESGASSYWPLRPTSGIVIRHPLPLSFPFYAFINHTLQPSYPSPNAIFIEFYQIEFLTLQFPQSVFRTMVYQNYTWSGQPLKLFFLEWGDYFLYYTFFFSLNLVGAIIGYWISRSMQAMKLLKGSAEWTKRVNAAISSNLEKVSLKLLVTFYVFLTAVDMAQTVVGFPNYETGIIAKMFITFLDGWAWLYFPFRIVLTSIIVILVYRYATPQVSKKLFVILSLITLAILILNTYS